MKKSIRQEVVHKRKFAIKHEKYLVKKFFLRSILLGGSYFVAVSFCSVIRIVKLIIEVKLTISLLETIK